MTYLSIIGGATGIQYFMAGTFLPEYNQGVHYEPTGRMWAECRQLALEIAEITPSILSQDEKPLIDILTEDIYASGWQEKVTSKKN